MTTVEQRRRAMANGQVRRLERTRWLRKLRAGELHPPGVIASPPAPLEGMFVFDLLAEIPRIGPEALRAINERAVYLNINLAVALGDLRPPCREWLSRTVSGMICRPLASRPQG